MVEKSKHVEGIEKIKLSDDEKKAIRQYATQLKKILDEDEGEYIITCLENYSSIQSRVAFDQLVKSLLYKYPEGIVHFILACLINPPQVVYEIKKEISDEKVKKFIEIIKQKYGYKIASNYRLHIGSGKDWLQIRSNPQIRDDRIVLTVEVSLANGELLYFTAPLRSVPILSYHFLKHINRTIDLLKERAITEISISEFRKISDELNELLNKIEKFEKGNNKGDESGKDY